LLGVTFRGGVRCSGGRSCGGLIRSPFGLLAAVFYRLGRYEPAATFVGFAATFPVAIALAPFATEMAQLRDLLGESTYESLARKAEAMTIAEMVTYAYDQIDRARTELNSASK
jgi:ribosomal protein S12 methylthiotransferase accessory factor YcaO